MSAKICSCMWIWILAACLLTPFAFAAAQEPATQKQDKDAGVAPARAKGVAPDVDEILEKYLEASGGAAAFKKISTRVTEGTFEIPAQGIKGSMKSYQKTPTFALTEMEIPQMMTHKEGTDGTVAWELGQMGPRLKDSPIERGQALRATYIDLPLRLKKMYPTIESKGMEEFRDKECYRLDCTPPEEGASVETLFFDKDTNLLHGMRVKAETPMGATTLEMVSKDYKEVDGINLPFTMEQNMVDMGMKIDFTTTKIEHNVEIPAAKFEVPAEIKKLMDANGKKEAAGQEEKTEKKEEKGGW